MVFWISGEASPRDAAREDMAGAALMFIMEVDIVFLPVAT